MLVNKIQLLNMQACECLVSKVDQLRPYWHTSVKDFFFTLGNALYQSSDTQVYWKKSRYYNGLLFTQFSGTYMLLLDTLSAYLKSRVGFMQGFSLPGFHIFEIGLHSVYNGGGPHFDLSHLHVFDKTSNVYGPIYSFTLPLQLPAASTGLDIWELQYGEALGLAGDELTKIAGQRKKHFIIYRKGELVVFSGLHLHQIAPVAAINKDDRRITLQGHCIFRNGYWGIYF